MKVTRDPVGTGTGPSDTGARADRPESVVTIGAFDGVHLGHRAVLRLVRELADARGLQAALVTFDRHPAEVVRPDSAPKLLTTLEHRLELLDATGLLDECVVLTFDERRSQESAADFVHEVLVDRLRARMVVVGADFHFGHRRGGNVPLLEHMGADLGFEVLGLGLVAPQTGSVAFSSTRVRELLAAGDVAGAAAALGRPHELRGTLSSAAGETGLAGAVRLTVDDRMCLPAPGRYTGSFAEGDGVARPAVISIGAEGASIGSIPLVLVGTGAASGSLGTVRLVARIADPVSDGGH